MADTIYEKVMAWAHGKLRQQVGRGECWDFVDQAFGLRASEAPRPWAPTTTTFGASRCELTRWHPVTSFNFETGS